MWLYDSYRKFSQEAAGLPPVEGGGGGRVIPSGQRMEFSAMEEGPPVIVAVAGELKPPYPMLEGRHRQSLPRVPGRMRGCLRAGNPGSENLHEGSLEAWLVPWRIGEDRAIIVTVKPRTVLVVDATRLQGPNDSPDGDGGRSSSRSGQVPPSDNDHKPRDRLLRRAAKVLEATPGAFSTEPSITAAYERLEKVWDDEELEEGDPLGELLVRHARRLRPVLEDLGVRPRAVLRTEHRMLKLQTVRRTDAKTLRWLSAQPGRNTAERAGARQRIKAPKRYETVVTLENRVLRAFAALTVREAKNWLESTNERGPHRAMIEAHQLRARRVETVLREREVLEARPPIQPNFPLRFDPRYRDIWRAWLELRACSTATELEWMWQHRTFIELLGLRAAMKIHEAVRSRPHGGTLAHAPVLRASNPPHQGRYLDDEGIRGTFAVIRNGPFRPVEYRTAGDDDPLGAVASAGKETELWWDALGSSDEEGLVGELPWASGRDPDWDERLAKWAAGVMS